ncbi:hypothetical protein B0H10DRAFT_2022813 [Mycena sp. CBHHK59/15]|nr:hypothetical protein B0H10DRAFT_2022813 [Mycena sp. CBHHK59/15]
MYRARYNDIPQALRMYKHASEIAEKAGDTVQQCLALNRTALAKWQLGEYHEGLMQTQEAERRAKLGGDFFGEANAIRIAAMCCISLGDFKRSATLCADGRKLLVACGLQGGYLDLLLMSSEADTLFSKSEYAEARKVRVDLAHKNPPDISPASHAYALCSVAAIDIATRVDQQDVRKSLDFAKSLVVAIPYPRGIMICDVITNDLDLREGRVQEAKQFYQQCFTSCQTTDDEMSAACLEKLGDIGYAMHTLESTFRWAVVALVYSLRCRNGLAIYHAFRCLGDIFVTEKDETMALSLFGVALDGYTLMDIHQRKGECMVRIGDIHKHQNEVARGVEMWKAALPMFAKSLQAPQAARTEEKLRLEGIEIDGAQ